MNSTEPITNISTEPVVMILLSGGFGVTETFYNEIKLQVEEVLPVLGPGVSYELKTLCGPEFWNRLSKIEQTLPPAHPAAAADQTSHAPLHFFQIDSRIL